jgi:hypothetical protein
VTLFSSYFVLMSTFSILDCLYSSFVNVTLYHVVVTTRDPRDLPYINQCLQTEIESIHKAGLLPTTSHIELFSLALATYGLDRGKKHLHNMLLQFSEMASLKSDYFLCRQTPMVLIAKKLASLNLSIVSNSIKVWM